MKHAEVIKASALLLVGCLAWPVASTSTEQSSSDDVEDIVQARASTVIEAGSAGVASEIDSNTGSNNIGQAAQQTPSSQAPNSWTATGPHMNLFNPLAMFNPATYMNMMYPMMAMMSPMFNFPVDVMTHASAMDMMMRSMNPHLIFGMFGQTSQAYKDGQVPHQLPVVTIPGFPTQSYQNWPKNKVSPGVSREAKKNAFQTAMAISPLSMRDMISIMTDKLPVDEGVSWDDAVEAMKLRANEVNFKFVGSSPLWKEIEAVTGNPSARVEMFRFCDSAVARKILDEVPEFIIFLPCQISLIEDGEGKLWVMTLDWSVEWLDFAQNPNSHLSKELREDAVRVRESIAYIMEGAATGDF